MTKTNKKFMILSFFGILLVVFGHNGFVLNMFNNIVPAYSFHMVLFIFISGYFYKEKYEENIFKYIVKKIKKLLIPFFIWNLLYGIFGMALRHFNIIKYGTDVDLKTLFIEPWIKGNQYMLNAPSWFIPALFLVNVIYLIIRCLIKKCKIWNDKVMFAVFAILSIVCGFMCIEKISDFLIPIYRVGFCLFFYHFGYCYKTLFENKVKIKTELYFTILIIIELVLLKITENNINYHLYNMNFIEENIICIFIAGIVGILFWVKIADILTPILKDNKLVNYIGNHTIDIVMHHMVFVFFINLVLYKFRESWNLIDFDIAQFKKSVYYTYTWQVWQFQLIYSALSIAGPLSIRWIYEKIKIKLKNKLKKDEKLKLEA